MIEERGEEVGTEVVFKKCDTFDPGEVGEVIGEILSELDADDRVIINYTAGPATIKLILGASAVAMSKILEDLKIVYAIKYPEGEEKYLDQTEELRGLFNSLTRIV